jgi:acyl-CoA synthetase (NDP forming)
VRVLGPNCIGVYNAFNGPDTMFLPAEQAGRPPRAPLRFSAP